MSENVVAVRSIEIVTAEITMIRDRRLRSLWTSTSTICARSRLI